MRATLHDIDPHHHAGWDAFARAEIPEPWDHFEWFTLSLGPEGDPGAEYFQVCVATPAAVRRVPGARGRFRGLVVDHFDAEAVRARLHEFVASLSGPTWDDVLAELRTVMLWEYEGMGGA